MLTKEQFIKGLTCMASFDRDIDALDSIGICAINSNLCGSFGILLDLFLESNFNKEALSKINNYIFGYGYNSYEEFCEIWEEVKNDLL